MKFNHITENVDHAPLKGGRCIAQPKRQTAIGKRTKQTSEGCIFLVFVVQRDLIVIGVPIKEIVVSMAGQFLKHLINEQEMEVIFSYHRIQLPVVNADVPS